MQADWGDCTLNLTEHILREGADREDVIYRLTGYVAYRGAKDITGGHFVAYFREGNSWYRATDARVRKLRGSPQHFPYICIFERANLSASPAWPASDVLESGRKNGQNRASLRWPESWVRKNRKVYRGRDNKKVVLAACLQDGCANNDALVGTAIKKRRLR